MRLQLDRINAIRSNVKDPDRVAAWSEAVEALADLLLPWANEADEKDKFVREWEERPVAVVRIPQPDGSVRVIPAPTATDCRQAERICLGLMDRKGLLVKRRTISGPVPRGRETESDPVVEM